MEKYNLIILGSGPGGYVAAIRASQLGLKTAIIEKENLGGICLNWGCIPTKALLKSAQVFNYLKKASDYGLKINGYEKDFKSIIDRSRNISNSMSDGVKFLMKKNKIDVIEGHGKILNGKKVEVENNKKKIIVEADNIIIATGARSRELKNIPQDQKKVIGYREAMSLKSQPKKIIIIGSGAIGIEFAYFYNAIGTDVTVIEYQKNILPIEDEDISKQLERNFKKNGIKVFTNSEVISVEKKAKNVSAKFKTEKKEEILTADIIISATGIKSNIENIGLEDIGIAVDNDKILVNDFYETNIPGYYAIGDITKGPALAHVASAEGILCVEKIAGHNVQKLDYNNIPGCTYCSPEVASVGMTEKQAKESGYDILIGKFPFSASGKAKASGNSDGFIKVIFDKKYGEWLGCHMIGEGVTDMIAEAVLGRKLETTGYEILKTVHPHPTMSEAVMEAVADAYGEVIHL
ncbi:MAG: dihydrolipoyl dehydrogenase [Flavobacteriaceae bacterium]|nr:dihydrolipoyl dehydrogenase [Flavobacteriaceae bacterium]|tara:strand:+ start:5855 stop:7243 length:1389 start_codon:yes stop_codon:yes gene_type:complete